MHLEQYRGANHVLVSRSNGRAKISTRKRIDKLLNSGKWTEVHLHGLGAAIAPTIVIASDIVMAANGRIKAHTRTSTEVIVDPVEPNDDGFTAKLRHNSAVHVLLSILE